MVTGLNIALHDSSYPLRVSGKAQAKEGFDSLTVPETKKATHHAEILRRARLPSGNAWDVSVFDIARVVKRGIMLFGMLLMDDKRANWVISLAIVVLIILLALVLGYGWWIGL